MIAGSGGWGNVRIDGDEAELLGVVSDEQLVRLYANASCLALPSLYEGFGLTAVEAMAAGTPVVAARAGSLPEVTGDAAILVDPYDVQSIASGIEDAIRKLPDEDKQGLTAAKAIALMLDQPSMIKRPVLELGTKLVVGFKPEMIGTIRRQFLGALLVSTLFYIT